ncbi:MAG: Bax inhibitor-1 family protein, partial [Crocinitomicaceae bacterium]|nr:Bax inhibitor-1 family protein [Crocinitomicaceae bacterium]
SYVISFCGLFVFTGLTAWEMQRMKSYAGNPALAGEDRKKQELLGGLSLYILFINLFMSILRFVGDR